jgi:hypothetical protein
MNKNWLNIVRAIMLENLAEYSIDAKTGITISEVIDSIILQKDKFTGNLTFEEEDELKENELAIPLFLKEYGLIYNFDRTKIEEEPFLLTPKGINFAENIRNERRWNQILNTLDELDIYSLAAVEIVVQEQIKKQMRQVKINF